MSTAGMQEKAKSPEPFASVEIMPASVRYGCAQDETLLDAAFAAGLALPNSCRNGTCRTCMCRMQEGQVAYTLDWPGLTREEQADGYVLPCVALPRSRRIVLEQPHALEIDDRNK
jgi:ferredoxin